MSPTVATLKKVNAKGVPEESVALRVAVCVAVLAAALATTAQGVGGAGLRLAATVGIAGGFVYSHWARFRSGYVLKAFLALGVLVAFASFLRSLTGLEIGTFGEVQVPLAELFLWVQFLHSVDVPARRDLQFSLLSSLVLMAVAGVLSRSLSLGLYLVVWFAAAVVSLVLAYRSELRELPALDAHVPVGDGERRRLRLATLRPAAAVLVLTAVVAGAAFLVVPSAGAGRAVAFPANLPRRIGLDNQGGLSNPSLGGEGGATGTDTGGASGRRQSFGYFGFAESLDTAVRGRPDETLVMKVRAGRPDFWRGQSFDVWDGRRWTQSDDDPQQTSGDAPIRLQGAPEDRAAGVRDSGEDFVQTVFVERSGPNLIFAAYAPSELYFTDRRVFELSDGTVRTGVQLLEDTVYSVVSRRPAITEEILRSVPTEEPPSAPPAVHALYDRYLQLPPGTPSRVTQLARDVAGDQPTTYDKVRALEAWMARNTSYTLDIPPLPAGADAVEQFLFVDKQGFCEQIGSALVVMLRSLGVPARLAVGYTPGERNPFTGLWEVRASDAHAWAEVWFPGLGWQAFDPTAQVPFAGDPFSGSAGAGLARWLGARLPTIPSWLPEAGAFVVAVGLPLVTVAWMARQHARARRREAERVWADRFLERLERAGARRGRPRRPSESARRYASALAGSVLPDPRLVEIGEAIEASAFGPPATEAGAGAGAQAWAEAVLDDVERAHPVRA